MRQRMTANRPKLKTLETTCRHEMLGSTRDEQYDTYAKRCSPVARAAMLRLPALLAISRVSVGVLHLQSSGETCS